MVCVQRPTWLVAAALLISGAPAGAQSPATSPAPAGLDSFKAIQLHFDELSDQAHREIELRRLAVLERFLSKAPPDDREPTLGTLAELAFTLDLPDKAVVFADEFLKSFPKSEDAAAVRKMKLAALAQAGRADQARKEWEAFLNENRPEAMGHVLDAGFQIAESFLDLGDLKTPDLIYAVIRDRLANAVPDAQERAEVSRQIREIVGMRTEMLTVSRTWVGKKPPPIVGKTLDGKAVDLNAYQGKVVLLDFWATWCQPCVAALPELVALYRKHHPKGFEVIGISLDVQEQALRQFLVQQKLDWPQVWDNQGNAGAGQNPFSGPNTIRYQLSAIPATFLIDRDGKIVRFGASGRALEQAVPRLLARPATQPAGTGTP